MTIYLGSDGSAEFVYVGLDLHPLRQSRTMHVTNGKVEKGIEEWMHLDRGLYLRRFKLMQHHMMHLYLHL